MEINNTERGHLIHDKYDGNPDLVTDEDFERLSAGEPLAYVIGWIPFLNLRIWLDSRPLIPRPETEWWTDQLIDELRARYGTTPFTLLDLCAGSGAIGLAVLGELPNAHVTFGELVPEHAALIKKNIEYNKLDATRAEIYVSDLFSALPQTPFCVIATNPPYIPEDRELPESVINYEPSAALFAGPGGLDVIKRIASDAKQHMLPGGQLWLETDTENAGAARDALLAHGALQADIRNDLYGRERIVLAFY